MVSAKTISDELKIGGGGVEVLFSLLVNIESNTKAMLKQSREMFLLTLTLCANIQRDLFT